MRMKIVETDEYTAPYAMDLQESLLDLACRHENVTLSQQISIIGATVGLIIEKISPEHQKYYIDLLFKNVREARNCAHVVTLN